MLRRPKVSVLRGAPYGLDQQALDSVVGKCDSSVRLTQTTSHVTENTVFLYRDGDGSGGVQCELFDGEHSFVGKIQRARVVRMPRHEAAKQIRHMLAAAKIVICSFVASPVAVRLTAPNSSPGHARRVKNT